MILLSPPPVEEYKHEVKDKALGYPGLTRFAHLTKSYAETCVEIGKELNVATVDAWSAFMGKAGWVPGQALSGSREAPENAVLQSLLCDGVFIYVS